MLLHRHCLVIATAALFLCQIHLALAQETKVTPLAAKPLPGFSGGEKEGAMFLVEYPPGASSAEHRHDAHVFVYVIQGSVVMQVKGGPELTLKAGETLYGAIFVKGPRGVSYPFSCQFLCSTWATRFFIPTHDRMGPAARRSGQGWRGSATEGSSLKAPSTTAHLARVGNDEVEGSSRGGARLFVPHPCMRLGTETQTMMQ
jgi:hypothetical protein